MPDTFYLALHWWVWVALALFGLIIGFAAAALLSAKRPGWSMVRRSIVAALVPVGLIFLGTGAGIGLVLASARPGDWSDLAVPAVAQVGTVAAAIAGSAAFAIAMLAQRLAQP